MESKYLKSYVDEIRNKPSFVEWCFIISISLMPFTSLKFLDRIGPSELIILLAFFVLLFNHNSKISLGNTFISRYYLVFMICCFIGMIFNFIRPLLGGYLNGTINGILFDMLSYVFILLTMTTFELYEDSSTKQAGEAQILFYIVNINCITMTFFFLLSRVRTSFLGMPLLYHGFFTPWALNLHHTSMYLLPLAFITLYIAESRFSGIRRLFYYAFAVFFMYLAISAGSTKGYMGVIVGAIISLFYKFTSRKGILSDTTKKVFLLVFVVALFYSVLNYKKIANTAIEYFIENDLNGGRQSIWSSGIETWSEAPVFGYGFGSHVADELIPNKYWDAHNTFLTALLQGGIIGCGVFIYLWFLIIKNFRYNGYILAMSASVLVYVAGGDVLRRIPNWSFLIICYYILEQQRRKNESDLLQNQFSTSIF